MDDGGGREQISIQRAIIQPFPPITTLTYASLSTQEKLDTVIGNLETRHRKVKSDLLAQALATCSAPEEPTSPPPHQDTEHDNDAILTSLRARWDSRAPKPIFRLGARHPHHHHHPQQQPATSNIPNLDNGPLQRIQHAVTELNAYDNHSARTMEKYYSSRERMRRESAGGGEAGFTTSAQGQRTQPQRTVSYDASRDPRLRR